MGRFNVFSHLCTVRTPLPKKWAISFQELNILFTVTLQFRSAAITVRRCSEALRGNQEQRHKVLAYLPDRRNYHHGSFPPLRPTGL